MKKMCIWKSQRLGTPFRRIPCNLHWKQTNKSRFILFLGYLVLLHVLAEWWKMTWQNMQRLKVNRHRPCLYRHYYLAVGFIVDKPCQTEVFQPIFCSYTAWITKNVRFGTSSSHFFPVSTGRFLICLKYHAHSIRVELVGETAKIYLQEENTITLLVVQTVCTKLLWHGYSLAVWNP